MTALRKWPFRNSLLFWNPLASAAFTFVFGGPGAFLPSWLISTAISTACMTQCYALLNVGLRCERAYCARRARPVPTHSVGWVFFWSAMAMPFSLPLGFAIGGLTARLLGV